MKIEFLSFTLRKLITWKNQKSLVDHHVNILLNKILIKELWGRTRLYLTRKSLKISIFGANSGIFYKIKGVITRILKNFKYKRHFWFYGNQI